MCSDVFLRKGKDVVESLTRKAFRWFHLFIILLCFQFHQMYIGIQTKFVSRTVGKVNKATTYFQKRPSVRRFSLVLVLITVNYSNQTLPSDRGELRETTRWCTCAEGVRCMHTLPAELLLLSKQLVRENCYRARSEML